MLSTDVTDWWHWKHFLWTLIGLFFYRLARAEWDTFEASQVVRTLLLWVSTWAWSPPNLNSPSIHYRLLIWVRVAEATGPGGKPRHPFLRWHSNFFWGIPRRCQAVRDIKPLRRVLSLPLDRFPTGRTWTTSKGRRPGGILIRCPNHLSWLLLMWGRSGSTSGSLQMPEAPHLWGWAQPPSEWTTFQLLVSSISLFWSLPKAHDHRWGFKWRWATKSKALPSAQLLKHPYYCWWGSDLYVHHLPIQLAHSLVYKLLRLRQPVTFTKYFLYPTWIKSLDSKTSRLLGSRASNLVLVSNLLTWPASDHLSLQKDNL